MRRLGIAVAGMLALSGNASMGRSETSGLTWDVAFPTDQAPDRVYFKARYLDDHGNAHALEVWREGRRRLRRVTDGRLAVVVEERGGGGDYEFRMADRQRGVIIKADRTSLYRIGRFVDWRGLAHVIDVPKGGFTLRKLLGEEQAAPQHACDWFELTVGDERSNRHVCWSRGWGIPLEIRAARPNGIATRFEVLDVRTLDKADAAFELGADGLMEMDITEGGEVSD
ncbi:hypothetical protein [Methylobacterium sp. WSM2598]|uniref:hypothetical protein n=1 Tax=Methylobacterium sp. WSM2598 TaxID=398261 RepID=UPI00035FE207|nr:hypothetical protein [Methylobacterium sp. WSM2598]